MAPAMDSQPPRPPPEPSPQMRRLAASIARSTAAARTLPGRLSRSLAPSREGRRHRLANLALLAVALVPFLVAWFTLEGRGGHGEWQVVAAQALPGRAGEGTAGRAGTGLLGSRVRFERHRVLAEAPLSCRRAGYKRLRQDRAVVLAALQADAVVAAPDLPAVVDTLRVDCGEARLDYHQAGADLLVRVDDLVLRLAPR